MTYFVLDAELQLLMALNHPNIVRCSECFVHQNKLCIVMDHCSEGGLMRWSGTLHRDPQVQPGGTVAFSSSMQSQ